MIKNYKNWLNENSWMGIPSELTRVQIIAWCDKWLGGRWKPVIHYKIEVKGDVTLKNMKDKEIPVYFSDHRSKFTIEDCKNLETLKGCPVVVDEFRLVDCPSIQTLESGPKEAKEYHIQNLGIKNLIGSPKVVTSVFNCANNDFLESFEGAPEKIEGGENIFYAVHCPKIKTLFGASVADAYFIDTETIENPIEKEWLIKQNANLDLIHTWLNSKMPIEEFLIKKRGLVSGKKYGL